MKRRTIGTIAVIVALLAAIAVPGLAGAGQGGTGKAKKAEHAAVKVAKKAARSAKSNGDKAAKKAAKKAARNAAKAARKAAQAARKAARKAARAAKKAARASGETTGAAKGQPKAKLEKRIANVTAARGHRFGAASSNLTRRISRIAALAVAVDSAGGDVSGVNAKLDEARAHLQTALALEDDAIVALRAVADAPLGERRAAFRAAKAKGRLAVAELKATRVSIREAARALRVIVGDLRSSDATGTVDAG